MKKVNMILALFVMVTMTVLHTGCQTPQVQNSESSRVHKVLEGEEVLGKWYNCTVCKGKGRCTTCKGSGKQNGKDCRVCEGTGRCTNCNGEGGYREYK